MFRQLASNVGRPNVFLHHPVELADYLELFWTQRPNRLSPAVPHRVAPAAGRWGVRVPTTWHHLVYAYAIEATKIVEIAERTAYECLNGERLGVLSQASHAWLRNTEDLFYKEHRFLVGAVRSDLRPDAGAVRRNAYYRMFGMELPHAMSEGTFVKAQASNGEFKSMLEDFLREAWIGIANVNNVVGANPRDDNAMAELARRLHQMLTDRRQHGALAREEFAAVAALSWLHLTVEFNSPLVVDLRADGSSCEQRLRKLGDKVDLAPHPQADSYFQIAEPLSLLLTAVESGVLNFAGNAPLLYGAGQPLRRAVEQVVTHWTITSGVDLKHRGRAVG